MKIILASSSPRRKQLMDLIGVDYEIMPSEVDETFEPGLALEEQVKRLGFIKAKEIFDGTQGDRTIIGSDTMVILDDIAYGKPKDRKDAIRMLKEIQGREHIVYTSLAILVEEKEQYKEYKELFKTSIYVKSMSDEEIEEYIDKEEPFDKAGAYAIQGSFSKFVDKIYGNYAALVGLPIHRIYEILKENEIG